MKPFDPFDPNNRDRRKRRTKAQIEADTRVARSAIDDAFRAVLEGMGMPDMVQGDFLLEDASANHENYYELRWNIKRSMDRIGYEVFVNENSSDGRWKIYGKNVTVFVKKGAPKYNQKSMKKLLEIE